MSYIERDVTLNIDGKTAKFDDMVYIFKGDRDIQLNIKIIDTKMKFSRTNISGNVLTPLPKGCYARVGLVKPKGGDPVIRDRVAIEDDKVKFLIDSTVCDELDEVGIHKIQIQIYALDDDASPRWTLPSAAELEVCKPDVDFDGITPIVGLAKAGLSMTISEGDTTIVDFNEDGTYNKTTWSSGDVISTEKLNKIENVLDHNVNKTREHDTQIKEIATSKLDKNEKINSNQLATDKDANKIKLINLSDEVQQALTGNAPALSVIPNKSITLEKIGFVKTGKNLINKLAMTKGKKLGYCSTTLEDDTSYYVTDYIQVDEGESYTCNRMYGYAYYDSNMNGISGHIPSQNGGTNGGTNTVTIPSGAKYIRINVYNTLIDTTQLEKGMEKTDYEEYYAYIKKDYVEKHPITIDDIPNKSININKLDFVKYSKNLFNYKKVSDKSWYMQYTDGVPTSNQYTTDLCYSDYIEVKTGEYIVNEILHSYCYFDENKKFISGAAPQKKNVVLTVPIGCKYIVINIYYDDKEKYQLEKGSVVTSLEPYGYNLVGMLDKIEENKHILSLPSKYELVVGDTFELFYKGILLCNNPYNYNIKITCAKGSAYSKRYIFTPTTSDIGTHTMTISVIDDDEKVLDTKTVNLVVKSKSNSPTTVKNTLCVGDSLTVNGVWVSELYRRLTGTSGNPIADSLSNVKFIGTCEGTNGAKYEGYGGWNYKSYNSENKLDSCIWITTEHTKTQSDQHSVYKDSNNTQWKLETIESSRIKLIRINSSGTLPSNGTLTWVSGGTDKSDIIYSSSEMAAGNPFWNDTTGQVDFSNYATSLKANSIDYCYVLLGWNQSYYTEDGYKESVRTFINNLLSSFPNCKIGLIGLQVPSLDGFGANYGCSWNYYDKLKFVFNVNQWYFDLAQEFDNVDFINLSGQFDSENNMQTSTRQVNVRNSKTEIYGTNGVHPANEGYLQIADAVYRHITHLLQS